MAKKKDKTDEPINVTLAAAEKLTKALAEGRDYICPRCWHRNPKGDGSCQMVGCTGVMIQCDLTDGSILQIPPEDEPPPTPDGDDV